MAIDFDDLADLDDYLQIVTRERLSLARAAEAEAMTPEPVIPSIVLENPEELWTGPLETPDHLIEEPLSVSSGIVAAEPQVLATFNPSTLAEQAARVPIMSSVRMRNSVLLPFVALTLFVLILAGAMIAWVGGGGSGPVVPQGVIDQQVEVAISTSDDIRRSLNSAVDDLDQMALVFRATPDLEDVFDDTAADFLATYTRFVSLELEPASTDEAVTRLADTLRYSDEGRAVLKMWAPAVSGGQNLAIVGSYDVSYLRFALGGLGSSRGWLVDRTGAVIASNVVGSAGTLPTTDLQRAAANATQRSAGSFVTGGSSEFAEIIAYSNVIGDGPGGQLGYVLVTARPLATMRLASVDNTFKAWTLAGAMVAITLVGLGWLYTKVVNPLRSLRRDAFIVANGELRLPVSVHADDEIGAAARSLEQIRISLRRLMR